MCSPHLGSNLGILAGKALNPGFIPFKDDPHTRTQRQIDYNDSHPKILAPTFESAYTGKPPGSSVAMAFNPNNNMQYSQYNQSAPVNSFGRVGY